MRTVLVFVDFANNTKKCAPNMEIVFGTHEISIPDSSELNSLLTKAEIKCLAKSTLELEIGFKYTEHVDISVYDPALDAVIEEAEEAPPGFFADYQCKYLGKTSHATPNMDMHAILQGTLQSGFQALAIVPDYLVHHFLEKSPQSLDFVINEPDATFSRQSGQGNFVLVMGDIYRGFEFVGPFDSDEEANDYAENYNEDYGSHTVLEAIPK